jgi:hypothetical protein
MSWAKAIRAWRSASLEGDRDQRAGLQALHPRDGAQVVPHAHHVDHLTAAHALGAGGERKTQDHVGAHRAILVGVGMGENLEGYRLQGVAGEHGGSFVIGLVNRRTTPAHVVVVHTGQVVVDQAVGLYAFQRAGRTQDRPIVQVEHPARLDGEEGAQTLAWPQGGVAHGLGQALLGPVGAGQEFIERHRHEVGGLGHAAGQGHAS